MNAQQMLAMGGFPDTAEGRQAFYNQYPDEASFHEKMRTGGSSGLAFPQQPTAGEFYAPQYTPNSPVGFYQNGGLAYPQQPPADMFFSGHPFTPEYARGGMPCMDCGGYMDDGGQASPFGYGQMPPTIGMAYGGSAKSFSKAMKKYFGDGGTASQGSSMEQNYNQQTKAIQAFIGGNVTNAIATEEYNKPVYDLGGEDTFNMDKQNQLIAMQNGLDMSEQQRQYQKQQNLSNLINSYALGGLPKHQTDGQVSPLYWHPNVLTNKGKKQAFEDYKNTFDWFDYDMANYALDRAQPGTSDRLMNEEYEWNKRANILGDKVTLEDLKVYEDYNKERKKELEDATLRQSEAKKKIPNWIPEYQQENEYTWPPKQMGGLPQAQMGTASDAERMFGQAPSFGKKTSPLYFGHTQGATAANATSGSLNPELIAKGNQLAQDIHNFNPSGAGVQFTPEQLRYLQSHGYGQQNQQQNSVWNPGYKVRAKGWENSADGTKGNKWRSKGTSDSPFPTFGPGPQGPGSFNMSRGLNEQQVADMNKYYNAHGMHMDYKQKNGLLGKWLGPKSYEMHIGSLSDHNQTNPSRDAASSKNKPYRSTNSGHVNTYAEDVANMQQQYDPSAPSPSSSSNPSGGFHPFDGMRERMAERKAGRSARIAARGERMSNEAEKAFDAQHPEFNGGYQKQHGGAPSVYFPHGYQEGGFNEVENDDYEDDGDYEYMDENEIAAYMAAGGVIKYV